ncbi:MAG: rRNA maturation RNase YbeY [Ignavibacteria bacterium]|nr:rRNA maturation RNase YbeY [Ignavibacteria bacterium]
MDCCIRIFNETKKKRIPRKKLENAVSLVLDHFKKEINILIVLVEDEQILELNRKFLGHNFVTDVISFDLSVDNTYLGEIYICLPQAERQAKEFGVSLQNELMRLAIHGILHILGFKDDTVRSRNKMRKLEDMFLNKIE